MSLLEIAIMFFLTFTAMMFSANLLYRGIVQLMVYVPSILLWFMSIILFLHHFFTT